jgi:membrane-bound lytic murein transglycosylase A
VAAIVSGCALAPVIPLPNRVDLEPAEFSDLPGWEEDHHNDALAAFRKSCAVLVNRNGEQWLGGHSYAGAIGVWRSICQTAALIGPNEARSFFEEHFQPLQVSNRDQAEGLFTGYYEPTLKGSRSFSARFHVPLYRRPEDLIGVDLGQFREDLKGERIAGRLEGRRLVPYADRAAIEAGALAGRGLELVWVESAVDAFFLHVQGSGRIELEGGGAMRVGFAGENGHPYAAIGKALVGKGELAPDSVSLQSLRAWLGANPAKAQEVMRLNRSYIFFRELEGDAPIGASGAPLTPLRSLAVDARFLPLGAPVWFDGLIPAEAELAADRRWRRLLIAQDTGGAIKGPVRGDVFFGAGPTAAGLAGRMKHKGRYWILLPKKD